MTPEERLTLDAFKRMVEAIPHKGGSKMPTAKPITLVQHNEQLAQRDAMIADLQEQLLLKWSVAELSYVSPLKEEVTSWRQKCAELAKRTEDLDTALYKEQTLRGVAEREAATLHARLAELRPMLEHAWNAAEARLGTADTISQEEHLRAVSQLQADLSVLKLERAELQATLRAACSTCTRTQNMGLRAEELAALRSQLALAEERRRPARHRPGAVVNVGWDPEGD
jgi:hypothetical protein